MDPPKDFETPKGLPNTYVIAPDGHVAKGVSRPDPRRSDIDGVIVAGEVTSPGVACAKFIVSGKVQGVCFRASTRTQAVHHWGCADTHAISRTAVSKSSLAAAKRR